MATSNQTVTNATNSKLKNKEKNLREATTSEDLDVVLEKVKKIDTTCCFKKCKKLTAYFAIDCRYCGGRFCVSHGLPEIHGCDEAVKRDEKEKFLHPPIKLSKEKHEQAATKLKVKLKHMQFERKAKQGTGKGKK